MRSEAYELLSIVYNSPPDQFLPDFPEYLFENMHIWQGFKELAFQMLATGRKNYSAKTIIQVLRWHSDLEESTSSFKISDKWAADFSRLFMYRYPEYADFFRTTNSHLRSAFVEEKLNG